MPVFNLANPLVTVLCLAALICSIILGHEIKRAIIPAIALLITTAVLVIHALQLFVFIDSYQEYQSVLTMSMMYDFTFVLLTYIAYLWVDDIEAKHRNKKSIDNSLDWFWSKI